MKQQSMSRAIVRSTSMSVVGVGELLQERVVAVGGLLTGKTEMISVALVGDFRQSLTQMGTSSSKVVGAVAVATPLTPVVEGVTGRIVKLMEAQWVGVLGAVMAVPATDSHLTQPRRASRRHRVAAQREGHTVARVAAIRVLTAKSPSRTVAAAARQLSAHRWRVGQALPRCRRSRPFKTSHSRRRPPLQPALPLSRQSLVEPR